MTTANTSDTLVPPCSPSGAALLPRSTVTRDGVAAAYPGSRAGAPRQAGWFVGSVIAMDQTREGHETETFIYFFSGLAQAHTYVPTLHTPVNQYCSTTTWFVASQEQLQAWVKLEQLAAGLRQAYRRQRAAARAQGREHVPALQRLLEATVKASNEADAHAGGPLLGILRNHGLEA